MTEDQKDQTVQSNRDGNQKQGDPSDQNSKNNQSDPSKKSSGTEEEKESTEEIKEQEDTNHPHKQGVPVSAEESQQSGI